MTAFPTRPRPRRYGKIMPFKVMRRRRAMYIDGANSFVANPNVFGPGSFWGKVLSVGAIAAGQVPAGTAPFAKYDGVHPGYDWRYTKLYMDMNHEVAPKALALGSASGGGCGDCHSATPKIPVCQLYPDPATRPAIFDMVACP